MPVGHSRDNNMQRVRKGELLATIKQSKGNGIFVKDLIRTMVNNPEDEFQRPRVLSITQGVAELQRERFVVITPAVKWDGQEGLLVSAV